MSTYSSISTSSGSPTVIHTIDPDNPNVTLMVSNDSSSTGVCRVKITAPDGTVESEEHTIPVGGAFPFTRMNGFAKVVVYADSAQTVKVHTAILRK